MHVEENNVAEDAVFVCGWCKDKCPSCYWGLEGGLDGGNVDCEVAGRGSGDRLMLLVEKDIVVVVLGLDDMSRKIRTEILKASIVRVLCSIG
jgi:hypothetical protein